MAPELSLNKFQERLDLAPLKYNKNLLAAGTLPHGATGPAGRAYNASPLVSGEGASFPLPQNPTPPSTFEPLASCLIADRKKEAWLLPP